jgi:DNA-binding response OmpR family regulator
MIFMAHILVVDDDLISQRMLSHVLRKAEFNVMTVSSADYALSALQEHSFDIVILDISMPDMDGIELLTVLRSQNYAMPVVMLTASSQDVDRVRAINAGANVYLTKPISSSEMVTTIQQLLRE